MENNKVNRNNLLNNLKVFVILLVFWLVLSEVFQFKYILMGVIASFLGTLLVRDTMILSGSETGKEFHGFDFPLFKYIKYWIWLAGQIIVANIQIALIVLNPKLPINPQIVVFKQEMDNPLAHVSLANSITLTPGTITIDIDDDNYIIHALTDEAAASLYFENGQGQIREKIAQIFGEVIEKDDLRWRTYSFYY